MLVVIEIGTNFLEFIVIYNQAYECWYYLRIMNELDVSCKRDRCKHFSIHSHLWSSLWMLILSNNYDEVDTSCEQDRYKLFSVYSHLCSCLWIIIFLKNYEWARRYLWMR
jgi:hypothetical protein